MFEKIETCVKTVRAVAGSVLRFKPKSETTIEIVGSEESGHGSCILVHDGDITVAIDCGASPQENGALGSVTRKIVAALIAARPKVMVISHFHFDHWGSLSAVIKEFLRKRINPPAILATETTWKLLNLFGGISLPTTLLKAFGVRAEQTAKIKLIPNSHSVPDSASVLLLGRKNILYTGDCWAIDLPADLPRIDVLIMDSTGAEKPNPRQDNELEIRQNIAGLIAETLENDCRANAYVAMFSTQLERAMWLESEIQRTTGFLPALMGTSLFNNLNLLRKDSKERRSNRVALTTGVWAQGEEDWLNGGVSAMVRLSRGAHTRRRLKHGDLVVLSGSIPTWSVSLTRQIKAMCQRMSSFGVRMVVDVSAPEYWSAFAERREVHAGGHGNLPEIVGLIEKIKPKQVLPFHASARAREIVAEYCRAKGIGVITATQSSKIAL